MAGHIMTENPPMHCLTSLLLCERVRRWRYGPGLAGYLSAGLGSGLLIWISISALMPYMGTLSLETFRSSLLGIWISWIFWGFLSGKDFSWHIDRDRLRIFPSPGFLQLFLQTFMLGFTGVPILAILGLLLWLCVLLHGFNIGNLVIVAAGFLLYAASIRLTASLVRCGIVGHTLSSQSGRWISIFSLSAIAICTAASLFFPTREIHPAIQFATLICEESPTAALIPMFGMLPWVGILAFAEFQIQRDLHFSAPPGTTGRGGIRTYSTALLHLTWSSPVFWISILGWLRSRSALMLFWWGCMFSFFWTYYFRPIETEYYFIFIFMNLLFHCHLRGNLLGIDRRGAWVHYRFPLSPEHSMNARSLSLNCLQGTMILCLLTAGWIVAGSTIPVLEWARILSYTVSSIFLGEICGLYFSIRHPESLDPSSQFDGGASPGALGVGLTQLLFLLPCLALSTWNTAPPMRTLAVWTVIPLVLAAIRYLALTKWVRRVMAEESETLLNKLAWH